jgi:hypothetical protein
MNPDLLAGVAVLPLLACWSDWQPLHGAGVNRQIPRLPRLYRIRRTINEPGLDYIGQTGGHLRGRLGQLGCVYRGQMPYRDPHTAAPALWALRHRDGCEFEASVIEVQGEPPRRKALEATAITLYRLEAGRSPTANFGRMAAGYRMSTGNNAQLVASGRRARGGPDPEAPAMVASAPAPRRPGPDPQSAEWMNWTWTPWTPVSVACRSAKGTGLYRIRDNGTAGLIYVGQGRVAARLQAHLAKARAPDHRQAEYFSGDLAASWVELPGTPALNLLEHENDLIAAHLLATGDGPAAQFFWIAQGGATRGP